jgi:hypothetical protein
MNLSVLYRGSLTSCNYSCTYCPFSKRFETAAQLDRDRRGLEQFVTRLSRETNHRWRVLFTPWGEALVRGWYRYAIARLTHLPQIESVAAQTNLSASLDWIDDCRLERLALWATYHPTETHRESFLNQVRRLRARNVRVSVGMVGVAEFADEIRTMRRLLPDDVYLWINAQQPRPRPYTEEEESLFASIDPQFKATSRRLPSLGAACRTGDASFTVNGNGDMRRCHFVHDMIGNFNDDDWASALRPRSCPKQFCDCFLGTSQLKDEDFAAFFGPFPLERLPNRTWTMSANGSERQ